MGGTATIAISPFVGIADKVTGGNIAGGIDSLLGLKKSSRSSGLAKPGMTQDEIEREARLAAARRRREYENVGRSSTILTGPGGLSGSGTGVSKTLLGM